MSDKEADKVVVEEKDNENDGASSHGFAAEVSNQLSDFAAKKIMPADSNIGRISSVFDNVSYGITDESRTKAVGQLGDNLTQMVTGELTHLREMMSRNGLDTKDVDAKIKAAKEQVEAVKPLHDAVLKGDIQSLQKLVATLKPEQLAQQAELLQKHFDRQGLGIELDVANGQLIVSRSHGDRAVAISKDKTDVIGINKDGSYDFSRQYRRENPGKELQGMADNALGNFIFPRYYEKSMLHNLDNMKTIQNSIGNSASQAIEHVIRQKGR